MRNSHCNTLCICDFNVHSRTHNEPYIAYYVLNIIVLFIFLLFDSFYFVLNDTFTLVVSTSIENLAKNKN